MTPAFSDPEVPGRIRRPHRTGGLALLETVVAISLLALLAAVSYPKLDGHITEQQLDADLKMAFQALKWAKRRALNSAECVQLCLPDGARGCTGPATSMVLGACTSDTPDQTFPLVAGFVLWRGLRKDMAPGFDGEGNPLSVTGSLHLCRNDGSGPAGRIVINRSGRIRIAETTKSSVSCATEF